MEQPIRVVLVDDHPVVRTGIRTLMSASPQLTVVAEGSDGAAALRLVREHHPDVLVLDLRMPGISGIEVLRQLGTQPDAPRVLVLSAIDERQYIDSVFAHGAHGYVLKDEAPEQIIAAVIGVARGQTNWVSQTVALRLGRTTDEYGAMRLPTGRELEVLLLLAQGYDNAAIADALTVTRSTVKFHLSNLYTRFGVNNRFEALLYAQQHGIIGPPGG